MKNMMRSTLKLANFATHNQSMVGQIRNSKIFVLTNQRLFSTPHNPIVEPEVIDLSE